MKKDLEFILYEIEMLKIILKQIKPEDLPEIKQINKLICLMLEFYNILYTPFYTIL